MAVKAHPLSGVNQSFTHIMQVHGRQGLVEVLRRFVLVDRAPG